MSTFTDRAERARAFAAIKVPEFGPEQTTYVARLRPGDFITTIPAHLNLPGYTVNSALTAAEPDHGWEDCHRPAGRRRATRIPVPGWRLTFASRATLSTPDRPVNIRRPLPEEN